MLRCYPHAPFGRKHFLQRKRYVFTSAPEQPEVRVQALNRGVERYTVKRPQPNNASWYDVNAATPLLPQVSMLSFVAGLLQTSKQERPTEHALEERTKAVFAQCDADSDGKLTKQDMYNYLVDRHINVSHIVQDKAFRILSGGDIYLTLPQLLQASCSGWLSDPISNRHSSMSITVLCRSRGSTGTTGFWLVIFKNPYPLTQVRKLINQLDIQSKPQSHH